MWKMIAAFHLLNLSDADNLGSFFLISPARPPIDSIKGQIQSAIKDNN